MRPTIRAARQRRLIGRAATTLTVSVTVDVTGEPAHVTLQSPVNVPLAGAPAPQDAVRVLAVHLPANGAGALRAPGHELDRDDEARTAFESLSYSHRKEYADRIVEAKSGETRRRRVAKTLEGLLAPGD
jgi:hypothetical protein